MAVKAIPELSADGLELSFRASLPSRLLEGREGPIRVVTVASSEPEPVPFYTTRLDRPIHWEGSDVVNVVVKMSIGGDR